MDHMTGSELYTYVLKIFKRTDKSAELYEAITDTVKNMNLRHKFSDMKVEAYTTGGITSDTDYRVELPEDFGHLIGDVRLINGTDSKTLDKLNKPEFDEKYPYLSNTDTEPSEPDHYCLWNNQILIGPIPDETTYGYEISYTRKIVTAIVSETTEVPFTDDYREAVRAGSLARLYEGLEDFEKAKYWHVRHDRDMAIIIANDINNESAVINQEYNGV